MNGIFTNYLWTTVLGKRILNILNPVIFPAKRFCLPMPFRFRKHERHNLPYDIKNDDVSAEDIKNCVKYIFVGRCLLIFLAIEAEHVIWICVDWCSKISAIETEHVIWIWVDWCSKISAIEAEHVIWICS
jgi:hypothetical protein